MNDFTDQDTEVIAITAALLEQGRTLHLSAAALTSATVIAVLLHPSAIGLLTVAIALALFAAETYLAMRVGLDARLFTRFSKQADLGSLDLQAFDRGMEIIGHATKSLPTRNLGDRASGAQRLLKMQSVLLLMIMATVGCAGAVAWGLA